MKRANLLLMALLALPQNQVSRVFNPENDNPAHLSPAHVEMNLQKLDSTSKRQVTQVAAPWSDYSWKANKGLLLDRYTDQEFSDQSGWRAKNDYLRSHGAAAVLQMPKGQSRDEWIASLSPAEKYDLLTGNVEHGLTENMAAFLTESLGSKSEFPSWWGLCEGSSPATMYYPEPKKAVTLHSKVYDLDIPFNSIDIKGLASLLWSRFNSDLVLPESGTQCQKNGDGCVDINPGSFHVALHHFLDLSPGTLIGEVDPTPTVWNFPLLAYSEIYFNPLSGDKSPKSLQESAVKISDWPQDPRARVRSPGTAYIVGVKMKFSYGVNRPEVPVNGSLKRKVSSREVAYELELDSNWNVLGGEWLSKNHPDLLWSIPPGTVPNSPGDLSLPTSEREVSAQQLAAAARISATKLLPLRLIVETLIRKSAKP
jgi:hypothetical protein